MEKETQIWKLYSIIKLKCFKSSDKINKGITFTFVHGNFSVSEYLSSVDIQLYVANQVTTSEIII